MRILLVYPFLPYPPNDGGRIGFFNPIKYLSKKHEVSVVSLTEDTDQEASVEELKKFCVVLRTFRRSGWQDPYRLIKGMIFGPPGASSKYWYRAMGKLIRETIAVSRPDIVEFHHLNTAIYREFACGVPTVLREHNVEFKVWERFAGDARSPMERFYARCLVSRVRKYEARLCARFDRCVAVSPADKALLKGVAPDARVEVIPSGVDTEYFFPTPDVLEEPLAMTLTGSFEWRPKQQSLFTLLTKIFPKLKAKLPGAKLYVVGKGVPDDIRRHAEKMPGVTVTGAVRDVRPYVARSSLLINYLESGGGIALKVLEAMAMRKPVLCNSLGCEGIPMKHGRDLFVADGPENFAEAAAFLLQDRAARQGLAEEGFRRVHDDYSWNVIADRFQTCYLSVIEERLSQAGKRQLVRTHQAP